MNWSSLIPLFALVAALQVDLYQCQTSVVVTKDTTGSGQLAPQTDAHLVASALATAATATSAAAASSPEQAKLESFKKSAYFLPLFDPEVISIPEEQINFVRRVVDKDLIFFREILTEAIEKRNNFAPSVSLMLKYSGKLLGTIISNRREEMKVKPRREPKPEFFRMLADLSDSVIKESAVIKKDKGYSKRTVDTADLYKRTDGLFVLFQKTIDESPVAAYLKWDELKVNKGTPAERSIKEEAADLLAQFRGMGYESCVFVAKRLVNLLRFFSKGQIPSVKDV